MTNPNTIQTNNEKMEVVDDETPVETPVETI